MTRVGSLHLQQTESSHSCDEIAFKIVAVLVSRNTSLQGQGPGWSGPRTFAQGQGQGLDPQGQGQGLKICPRGQVKAKDQGQGQQHWYTVVHSSYFSFLFGLVSLHSFKYSCSTAVSIVSMLSFMVLA